VHEIATRFPEPSILSATTADLRFRGADYDEDRDECPDCGCLDAQLIDTGGGPGRF
jgi:hypothetical protein